MENEKQGSTAEVGLSGSAAPSAGAVALPCIHCGCRFRQPADASGHCCAAMQEAVDQFGQAISCVAEAVYDSLPPNGRLRVGTSEVAAHVRMRLTNRQVRDALRELVAAGLVKRHAPFDWGRLERWGRA